MNAKPESHLLQVLAACFFLAVTQSGCDTTKAKGKKLARVAKDWSLVVRASQVIPVYPLTEDILPGDLFLVRTRIEDQIKEYEKSGFLPLDQLVGRIQPENYGPFYLGAYGIGAFTNTPYHWKFPDDASKTNELLKAPGAAFPSYSFTIKRGGGINLALPVEGVPVALNLLGASSAHGDITISDAHTFGIDIDSLWKQVVDWAAEHEDFLSQLAPSREGTNYLRVVNRIYWTGGVNVSVFSDQSFSGAVSGGVAKPVNLPDVATADTASNYGNALSALTDSIASAATPGGTLKVAAASSRSISMNETFPRPLTIGYLGFDVPIMAEGKLGPPISTKARLHKANVIPATASSYEKDANTALIQQWLKGHPERRDQLRQWLNENGQKNQGLTNVIVGHQFAGVRKQIVEHFNVH